MLRFIAGNDTVYVLRAARAADGSAIPTSATGTLTVRDSAGATVAGPVVFAWSPTLNGFAGTIPGSLAVADGGIYEITVELAGAGVVYRTIERMRAHGNVVAATIVTAFDSVGPVPFGGSASMSVIVGMDSTGPVLFGGSASIAPTGDYDPYGISSNSFTGDEFLYADELAWQAQLGMSGGPNQVDPTRKYWIVERPDLATLDPTVLFNGHQTIKSRFPGDGTAATFQPKVYFSNPLNGGVPSRTNVWARWRLRHQPVYGIAGQLPVSPPATSAAYKLAFLTWGGTASQAHIGRMQFEYMAGPQLYTSVGADNVTGPDDPFTEIKPAVDNAGVQPSLAASFSDGLWYEFIMHFHYPSLHNWRARWWWHKVGDTPTKISDFSGAVTLIGGGPHIDPMIDGFSPGRNYNQDRDVERIIHWGSWECADGTNNANPLNIPPAQL